MKKFIILIPIFNDWDSLKRLISEVNKQIAGIRNAVFNCIVVNDASTISRPKISKPNNFSNFKIMNMRVNKGHARCNAFGIRYVKQNEEFDYLILMDGDGEDRPEEIKNLVSETENKKNLSIVAKRIKRSEGPIFKIMYQVHKIITLIFSGKKVNFGNYSCLTKKDVEKISDKPSLWSSFSGTLKKNVNNLGEINSVRGLRYFGPSQMSLFKLLIHSFSIIAVFKYNVFFRSIVFIAILWYLNFYLGLITIILQIMIIIFNLIIFVVSFREKKNELLKSQENLNNIEIITH